MVYGVQNNIWPLALVDQKQEVHELSLENSQLRGLLNQLKALGRWRTVVSQGKLHTQLQQSQQREISCRTEALKVQMMSEEEVLVLKEELEAMKKAIAQCQTEISHTRRMLAKQSEALQAVRHRSAEEARGRQELDGYRQQSMEQLRGEVLDREEQLRALSLQLDRGCREGQLYRQRSAKDIQQVRSQLQVERSLKQEAFQQVDKLQTHICDFETALSRCSATSGQSKKSSYTVALSQSSLRNVSAGHSRARQQPSLPCRLPQGDSQGVPDYEPSHLQGGAGSPDMPLQRAKSGPSRLRVLTSEALLPDLSEGDGPPRHFAPPPRLRTSRP